MRRWNIRVLRVVQNRSVTMLQARGYQMRSCAPMRMAAPDGTGTSARKLRRRAADDQYRRSSRTFGNGKGARSFFVDYMCNRDGTYSAISRQEETFEPVAGLTHIRCA